MKGLKVSIITVTAILVIVVVLNWPYITTEFKSEETVQGFIANYYKAPLEKYKLDTGDYPTTQYGLEALVEKPIKESENWRGPYVPKIPLDPWGREFIYEYPSELIGSGKYAIYSLGPDGRKSGDDIGNWNKE